MDSRKQLFVYVPDVGQCKYYEICTWNDYFSFLSFKDDNHVIFVNKLLMFIEKYMFTEKYFLDRNGLSSGLKNIYNAGIKFYYDKKFVNIYIQEYCDFVNIMMKQGQIMIEHPKMDNILKIHPSILNISRCISYETDSKHKDDINKTIIKSYHHYKIYETKINGFFQIYLLKSISSPNKIILNTEHEVKCLFSNIEISFKEDSITFQNHMNKNENVVIVIKELCEVMFDLIKDRRIPKYSRRLCQNFKFLYILYINRKNLTKKTIKDRYICKKYTVDKNVITLKYSVFNKILYSISIINGEYWDSVIIHFDNFIQWKKSFYKRKFDNIMVDIQYLPIIGVKYLETLANYKDGKMKYQEPVVEK